MFLMRDEKEDTIPHVWYMYIQGLETCICIVGLASWLEVM